MPQYERPIERKTLTFKEKFIDFYQNFKTVRDIVATEQWKEQFSYFYDFEPWELDIKINETKEEQEEYDVKKQAEEFKRCQESFPYFCHKYIKILTLKYGTIPFILYRYQRRVVEQYGLKKHNMISKFRQGGLTTLAVLYALWRALFTKDQTIYVFSKADREAIEAGVIVSRAMDYIPSWMYDKDKTSITKHEKVFGETNSKICFYTPEAGRGKTANWVIIDEAAFIDNMHEHYMSIYPIIAAGGNLIVISTVNGMGNWYEETYREAEANQNFFNIIELDYWEHPDYAHPDWERETRANLGEEKWAQEIERVFLGSGRTYINKDILIELEKNAIERQPLKTHFPDWTNLLDTRKQNWESGALWIWQPPLEGHEYIMGIDTAEGKGDKADNSCFQIIDKNTLEQVAEFYSNRIPPRDFAVTIYSLGCFYNTATIVVETQSVGGAVASSLEHDLAYENLYFEPKKSATSCGIKMSASTRPLYLETMQHRLINKSLKINSRRLVHELKTFYHNAEKKRPEAQKGRHDDAIMALCYALYIRDLEMRGGPVGGGGQPDPEALKIFKSNLFEQIKKEILDGSLDDWEPRCDLEISKFNISEDEEDNSIRVRRRYNKLLEEFGW